MQYSIVNGQKIEAQPNLVGQCICCDKPTYSACGNFNTWHWRHRNKKECDSWWETETDWHREWKSNFPETWREVIHFDNRTNEKHIADIKTHSDVILEFQNSPISLGELSSREQFYKKMVWVINGLSFKNNFEFGYKLPDPNSKFPNGFKFLGYRHMLAFDNLKYPNEDGLVEILHKIDGILLDKLVEQYHTRHYTFNWKKARLVWLKTQMPIFIDFNDGILWRLLLKSRLSSNPICACYSKKEFIKHYLS